MRHDRRQHQHDCFQRLANHATILGRLYFETIDGVEQLHGCRNCGIEGVAAADVVTDLGYRLVRLSSQITLLVVQGILVDRDGFAVGDMGLHGIPETPQEARRALHALIGPFQRLFGWRGEHHEKSDRIGAVFFDELLRIDGIAFCLGHLCTVFQNHALRQKVGERLVSRGQTEVAHDFLEEARIEEMQDRVLYAARVLIDRHPVPFALIEHGGVAIRTRITREIP